MNFVSIVIGASLLLINSAILADTLNGTVKGFVDSHEIDVAVACNRETMGSANWIIVNSEPLLHGGVEDRNGDGIAIMINSDGNRVLSEVLITDQRYKFMADKDAEWSATGLTIKATINRYEGKGKDQKKVGEYEVDLTLTCPEA